MPLVSPGGPAMLVSSAVALLVLAAIGFSVRIVGQVDDLLRPARTTPVRPQSPHELASARDVAFSSADGLTIRGWFLPGPNRAAIVLCHGHGENRAQMIPEAALLARHGFGVLLFDWRAHGESDGVLSTRGDHERRDLKGALDFLEAQEGVDIARIGALGFSRGGSVVIEVAAEDERVRAVIAEAAATSLADALVRDVSGPAILSYWPAIWAARRAGIDVDGFRPENSIARLSPRPLLIIHGKQDLAAPVQWAMRLDAAAKEPKALWLVDGAGHGQYSQAAGIQYEQEIVAFFSRALTTRGRPPVAPQRAAPGGVRRSTSLTRQRPEAFRGVRRTPGGRERRPRRGAPTRRSRRAGTRRASGRQGGARWPCGCTRYSAAQPRWQHEDSNTQGGKHEHSH